MLDDFGRLVAWCMKAPSKLRNSRSAIVRQTLTILTFIIITGCSRTSDWTLRFINTPFVGADETVVAKTRSVSGLGDVMSASGSHTEYVWVDSKGNRYDPRQVTKSVEEYFLRTGMMKQFRKSQCSIDGIEQVVPGYRICLISIEPTIVLMIPHDFGELVGRSNNEIIGDTKPWGSSELCQHLLDGIFTGTNFPYADGILWFNARADIRPARLESLGERKFVIRSEAALFEITEQQGRIFVRRKS